MDFIAKLPKSKDPTEGTEYDFILTVVDRLTKCGIFISFKEGTDAPETAKTARRKNVDPCRIEQNLAD